MTTVRVIGIGLGEAHHLTHQAVEAIERTDVFFSTEKGTAADDLARSRRALCERFATTRPYRWVQIPDPRRDRVAADYQGAVDDWTRARAALWADLLAEHLTEGRAGAFLAWGDPAFYDSTIRVLDLVRAAVTLPLEIEVVPGISSLQALAAAHRISLTRVGRPVHLTTGRRLTEDGVPPSAADVVVMLDGDASFRHIDPTGWEIFWGAYLGGPDQLLLSGDLAETAASIVAARTEAKSRRGWIMDTYLLRRRTR
jgi:precorrin-6A synthase